MKAPKGTRDFFGTDIDVLQHIEAHLRRIARNRGFFEIRTPIFEHTELFLRGVGDTTDIVQKEMYTFLDKAGRSISLRPELTAGVGRAYLEGGMASLPQPIKLWYLGPNFRYEKPQAGRYRQHTQFGVEIFGAGEPAADAEVISLGHAVINTLCPGDIEIKLNSIGCADCRVAYNKKLLEFLTSREHTLCELCKNRKQSNPLRVLDCKNESCASSIADAPMTMDNLCEACVQHFAQLENLLTAQKIPYEVHKKIVRGLDYYTRTVFEFMRDGRAVLGGGRYDGLIEMLGGAPTPGVGFGMGMERLAQLVQPHMTPPQKGPLVYLANASKKNSDFIFALMEHLRRNNIAAETDLCARSLKAQLKHASKTGATFLAVVGEDEIQGGMVELRNMQTSTSESVEIDALLAYLEKFVQAV